MIKIYENLLFVINKINGEITYISGSKQVPCQKMLLLNCNLNSITDKNFIKIFRRKSCISINKSDMICLSKTYFYNYVPINDENLLIAG